STGLVSPTEPGGRPPRPGPPEPGAPLPWWLPRPLMVCLLARCGRSGRRSPPRSPDAAPPETWPQPDLLPDRHGRWPGGARRGAPPDQPGQDVVGLAEEVVVGPGGGVPGHLLAPAVGLGDPVRGHALAR